VTLDLAAGFVLWIGGTGISRRPEFANDVLGLVMPDDIKVDKSKFDSLLKKMLATPPLPKDDVKTPRSKSKKRRREHAA
jgi:hypothetical protein